MIVKHNQLIKAIQNKEDSVIFDMPDKIIEFLEDGNIITEAGIYENHHHLYYNTYAFERITAQHFLYINPKDYHKYPYLVEHIKELNDLVKHKYK